MSFLLWFLGAFIVINLIYLLLQRFLKFLFKKLPLLWDFSFNLGRHILYLLRTSRKETPKEENDDLTLDAAVQPTKELQRTSRSWRSRLSTYLEDLDNGRRTKFEHSLWKWYNTTIPEYYRAVNYENGTIKPLPRWIETFYHLYENQYLFWALKLLLFYIFIIMSSHLWAPFLGVGLGGHYTASPPLIPELSRLFDLPVGPCVAPENTSDVPCWLFPHNIADFHRFTNHSQELFSLASLRKEYSPSELVLNAESHYYYAFSILMPQQEEKEERQFGWLWSSEPKRGEESEWFPHRLYMRLEETIEPLLEEIRIAEGGQKVRPCVCPIFLNILGNLSFLYESGRWLVLWEPTIQRNNSFAELVASTVHYDERSRFFKKNDQLNRSAKMTEILHYDSFVVEYTDYSGAVFNEEPETLRRMNQKVKDYLLVGDLEGPHISFVYKNNEGPRRKRIQLTESDAICFIYCDTLNRRLFP